MKRINIILCFIVILASVACISLPKFNLPQIKTQPPTALPASATPTTAILPPTEAPATAEPTLTSLPPTEVPSNTPEPTFTPLPPTPTPEPFYPVRVEAPSYLPNFTHAEKGCNWFGVGGQIFDLNSQPVQGWTIMVTGTLNGEVRQWLGLSGLETAFGPAGYEIELGDIPLDTIGVFTIQLRDATGNPLTEDIGFDTRSDCQSNLIIINFVQAEAILTLHLPLITRSGYMMPDRV